MSFGHFAGGFAEAFSNTMFAKKEQKRRDEMAKLQGKLVELQMQNAEDQAAARGRVQEASTGQLGEFQIQPDQGLGEFEITPGQIPQFQQSEGRNLPPQLQGDAEPMGLAQMMVDGDPSLQFDLIQSGYARPQDFQEQSEVMRLLDAAGYEKGTPEYQDAVKNYLNRGGESELDTFLKNQQAAINLEILDENLLRKRQEREQKERTEIEQLRGRQNAVSRTFDHIKEIQQLQESLSGTLLASGMPINDAVRQAKAGQLAFMQVLGLDPTEQMNLLNQLDQYDRLAKLYSVGVLESLERFDLGNPTDVKFNELKRAVASGDKTAFSNLQLLADALEEMLAKAHEKQVPIEQEEEIRTWIEQIKSGGGSSANQTAEPVIDANEVAAAVSEKVKSFAKMTKEAIDSISAEDVLKFTEEEFNAFKKRYQETR